MSVSPADRPAIDEALRAFGITAPANVEVLEGGAANEHWRVDVPGEGARVLRRYHRRQTQASVAYEHRLLQFLHERGWPVAPAIVASGGSQLETDSGRWALFPFRDGEPPVLDQRTMQRKGSLLALLHADLRDWGEGQRPGFGRITDLDTPLRLDGFADFHALVAWFALTDPERAAKLEDMRDLVVALLGQLGYNELPDDVVYFECLGNNILFEGNDVTALLDFDLAHRDARVADIGRSLVTDAWMDGWQLHAFIAGYQAHAEPQLTPTEATLVAPMMLAAEFWTTCIALAISDRHPSPWLADSIRTAIDERLPKLEAAQAELARVIKAAAGYPHL
ncbi:MAG: phosphotransferase [Dehalococcoidia bacterium]|nr:phosphotransferase [Dehalococcoidia bacterium]